MLKAVFQKMLQKMGYQLVHFKNNNNNGKINFLDPSIDLNKYEFLVRGKQYLQQLIKEYGAQVKLNKDEQIVIEIQQQQFYINTWEEILILNEVFCEGMYNYISNNNYLLIDIGMNVGITSLFHSKNSNCKKIFSFEPFDNTIQLAQQNFALNNSTSNKIEAHKIGLGFPARSLQINYSAEYKGSVGINGIAEYVKEGKEHEDYATLEIADVAEMLAPIFNENATLEKVLKIDAEGVEYEIIERLAEVGLLKEISSFMIEWHLKGPKPIEDVLLKDGFKIISFNTKNKQIGMLYAFNASLAK